MTEYEAVGREESAEQDTLGGHRRREPQWASKPLMQNTEHHHLDAKRNNTEGEPARELSNPNGKDAPQ